MTESKSKDLASLTGQVYALLGDLTTDERNKVVTAVMALFGQSVPVTGTGGSGSAGSSPAGSGAKFTKSLATYLADKQAQSNQVLRFLAAADWLRLKGTTQLNTKAVTEALRNNNQSRLGNPADVLNKNVAKGLIEKDGKNFFITPEGLISLGHHVE